MLLQHQNKLKAILAQLVERRHGESHKTLARFGKNTKDESRITVKHLRKVKTVAFT